MSAPSSHPRGLAGVLAAHKGPPLASSAISSLRQQPVLPCGRPLSKGAPVKVTFPSALDAIQDPELRAQCVAKSKQLVADAVTKDGAQAFEMPRDHAIAHEVGHLIVGAHDGRRPTSMSLIREEFQGREAWGGVVVSTPWMVTANTDPEEDLRNVCYTIAGFISERLIFGNEQHPLSSLDEVMLSQILATTASTKLSRDPQQTWQAMVERGRAILRANAWAVQAAADQLDHSGHIAGACLNSLLNLVTQRVPSAIQFLQVWCETANGREEVVPPSYCAQSNLHVQEVA